jgi:hypothetical protein
VVFWVIKKPVTLNLSWYPHKIPLSAIGLSFLFSARLFTATGCVWTQINPNIMAYHTVARGSSVLELFQAPGKEALSSIGLLIQFSIDKIFNGAATI